MGGGQKGWPYKHLLPPTDTQALRDFSLGFQRREDRNSALPEIRTRIRVLCQEEVISLQSSAQAEGPSTRFLHPGPGEGLEKQGRIGRVKERKERGEGREVNKVSCSLPVGALWLVVRVRRRPGTKGSWFPAAGSGPLAGKLTLSTPSGQDVSLGEEESPPESPFVAGRGTPFRARNWALV